MKNILVFGDSNSWGYDYTTYHMETGTVERMALEERWPGRLQLLLGDGYRVIEDCLNGRTSVMKDPFMPKRLGLKSLPIALEAHAPLDLVVIQLGCNELKPMFHLTAEMIAAGVEQLVVEAKKKYYAYNAPQILIVIPHPTHPNILQGRLGSKFGTEAYAKSMEFSKWYQKMAIRQGVYFLDCAPLQFEINEFDGLHYSKGDHHKLANAMAVKIRSMQL